MATATLEIPIADSNGWHYPPQQGGWTFDDYLEFIPEDDNRYEIIHGYLYMNAASSIDHQTVLANLSFELMSLIRLGKLQGKVLFAPTDVVMSSIATPVQPDMIFVREENLHIVEQKRIVGVPDLLVEVLSSNVHHDRKIKYTAYAEAGVAEYWIIDPVAETVEVYVLRDGIYVRLGKFEREEPLRSEVVRPILTPAKNLFIW